MRDTQDQPSESDWYRFDDMDEIVFAIEQGRVLTVREYPSVERFHEELREATYVGTHPGVADLPDVEEFESGSK